jgi:hypothetical protein
MVQAGAALGLLIAVSPAASHAEDGGKASDEREAAPAAELVPARLTWPAPRPAGFWPGGPGSCLQAEGWGTLRARFEAIGWTSASGSRAGPFLELSTGAADEVFKRAPYLGADLKLTGADAAGDAPRAPDRREDLSIAEGRSPTAAGMRF